MKPRLHREVVLRSGRHDVYVTCIPTAPISDDAGLRDFFDELVGASDDLVVVHGKIYGLCARRSAILRAARSAFQQRGLDPEFPMTFLEGCPCEAGVVAGVQLLGTIPVGPPGQAADIATVRHDGTIVGRRLRVAGHRMVLLAGVSGFEPGGNNAKGEQAQRMFSHAAALLEAQELGARHRTDVDLYSPYSALVWRVQSGAEPALPRMGPHRRLRGGAAAG